jgi:nucleoside-diphosphate-sugar epimerase
LAILADSEKVTGHSFNIGKIGGNYTVREIAIAAQKCVNRADVIFNTENISDPRSYKVNFEKAKSILGFEAKRDLVESGQEILMKFEQLKLSHDDLMGRMTNRLAQVAYLRKQGGLDESLRFV